MTSGASMIGAERQADRAGEIFGAALACRAEAGSRRAPLPELGSVYSALTGRIPRSSAAQAWLRRVSSICTTVQASTIIARISDSAAP